MILYSERDNHYSHRVRIVLAEKDIACEIREFDIEEAPDDISDEEALFSYNKFFLSYLKTLKDWILQLSLWQQILAQLVEIFLMNS